MLEPTLADATWHRGKLSPAWVTPAQLRTYLAALDGVLSRGRLPVPSALLDAFLVCRVIAMCSGTPRDPAVAVRRRDVAERCLGSFLQDGRLPIAFDHDA